MIHIGVSHSTSANDKLKELRRKKGEDNIAWLQRAAGSVRAVQKDSEQYSLLLLLGGTSTADFRLRIAQAHARTDLTPSSWSHIGLLDYHADEPINSVVHEISLQPEKGFGFPPVGNAVQEGSLHAYSNNKVYRNIALLVLPVAPKNVEAALRRFRMQRSALDAVELLVAWMAFTWGVASTPNPLLSGIGMPSASMVEAVVSYAGFELTPGMPSRSSCPEAVWQSALWWHEYYAGQNHTPITGCWNIEHWYIDE